MPGVLPVEEIRYVVLKYLFLHNFVSTCVFLLIFLCFMCCADNQTVRAFVSTVNLLFASTDESQVSLKYR